MTKKEAMRRSHQEDTLLGLGFTREEAESLRRISMTLRRWHEHECNGNIQREGDDGEGRPRWHSGGSERGYLVPDREKGALKRLAKIMNARLYRQPKHDAENDLTPYIQTDPRGAALYILRPGDVPAGGSADAYYSRGICVY